MPVNWTHDEGPYANSTHTGSCKKIIIDTDPGIDDAVALLLALSHPSIEILALTTVAGNASVEHTTQNARRILSLFQSDIPLFAGCDRPLCSSVVRTASDIFGSDGFGDVCWAEYGSSNARINFLPEHASIAIVRFACQFPGEITLCCLGPLTNIAIALRLEPRLPELLKV